MSAPAFDPQNLQPFLPEVAIGHVERVEPLRIGLSGAGVFAVTASRGKFVLRLQARGGVVPFEQQLLVLRRAAAAGIAPALVHVDEPARAVVSVAIAGVPLAAVLANPNERDRVLASVVDQLRALHALDTTSVGESDPVGFARRAFATARGRPGFPTWASELEPAFQHAADALGRDARRGVSHNDVNPTNFLWDGARAWLVDWEMSGVAHPHYDLATLALFLRLDDAAALGLCARHDGAPLDDTARETFHRLRKLVALLCGLVFCSLVDDLDVRVAATIADAPALGDVYAAMRSGQIDMQTAYGKASMALALLAAGCEPTSSS